MKRFLKTFLHMYMEEDKKLYIVHNVLFIQRQFQQYIS